MAVDPLPLRREALGLSLVASGILWGVASGYWDVYSHRVAFGPFDPWWNPAHLSLYAGVTLAVAALWWSSRSPPVPGLRPAFQATTLGIGMQVAAGLFNEAWHRLGGPSLTLEPPHILLVLGMIVAAFGSITGLATLALARGPGAKGGWAGLASLGLLIAFAAMWLAAVGSTIFIAFAPALQGEAGMRPLLTAVLAAVATLVAIPAARVAPWPGFNTALGVLLAGVNWGLLVGYLHIVPYIPWSVLPLASLDLLHPLRPRLGARLLDVIGGVMVGVLTYAAAFPFSFGLLTPPGLNPETAAGAGAGVGAALLAGALVRGTGNWVRRSVGGPPASSRPLLE